MPAPLSAEEINRVSLEMLRTHLPTDRAGDALYAYVAFLHAHRRPPTRELLFNDVLHHFKISPEILDPLRVFTSDKEHVKSFIRTQVGDAHNVPTVAVLRDADEIDRFDFPGDVCIKPTHASGLAIFHRRGAAVDRDMIKKWLSYNYYLAHREANYKTLTPKIIVEPLLFGSDNVNDYKFFCRDGRAKLIQVDVNRRRRHRRQFFDPDWRRLPIVLGHPDYAGVVDRPGNLAQMRALAEAVAAPFKLVRTDVYSDGRTCYVGEITHCHGAGTERFASPEAEALMSQIIFS